MYLMWPQGVDTFSLLEYLDTLDWGTLILNDAS